MRKPYKEIIKTKNGTFCALLTDKVLFLKSLKRWRMIKRFNCFFSFWFFFHEHSEFTGQQGKGEAISLSTLYHFHPLHRHLDISWAVNAENSALHIGSSRAGTGNLWFPSASR